MTHSAAHTDAETTVISCGCCRGPVEDRCCCHMHQDITRGLRAHKCSLHTPRPSSKFPVAYVKSLDGKTWYVGDKPLRHDMEPSRRLQGYLYCAREPLGDRSNFERATAYARSIAHKICIMELGVLTGITFRDKAEPAL